MSIDGRVVEVPEGGSVLDAARRAGVRTPTLCYHPALPVDGSCRMCVVEITGRPGLHAACVLRATDGLEVRTETPALGVARRTLLRLLLARYRPGAGKADNELLALARRYDVPLPVEAPPPAFPPASPNPFISVDRAACIRCWRCVRACDLLNGVTAIGVFGRGDDSHVGFGFDGPMQESACEFCGMCEAVCPTDALTLENSEGGHPGAPTPPAWKPGYPPLPKPPPGNRGAGKAGARTAIASHGRLSDRLSAAEGAAPKGAGAPSRAVSTLCSYCGVGCRLNMHIVGDRIAATSPDWSAPANHGLLCVKGRFGWTYVHHRDRLTRPLVRRSLLEGSGSDFVETDWNTALDLVARTLIGIREQSGADALGFLASAKCSNEENYLFQKLARQVFGTNNVDHCARLCHAPTVAALGEALGSGAMTNSFDDIVERAQCVFIVGSNTTEQHPVFGMRLRRAARERGLPIVVVDPRRIPIVEVATLHLPLRPGTDIALLNAIAHVLIVNGWIDREFVETRAENFAALAESVRADTPERASEVTGVPPDDIRRAARLLWERRPGALLFAMGITQHTCGTANAFACTNLQLLLGNLGIPGSGVNPLRGQNNVQGACDVGALPDVFPGYQPVRDPAVRARFEAAWGVPLPDRPGLTVTELFDGALSGRVRGLYIMGENAAMTDPDLNHLHRCLAACELLVVQEIFLSETARFAHVVLPAAATAEKDGTFTNAERRVQLFAPAVSPPGEARPDWWIIAEMGRRVSRLTRRNAAASRYAEWAYASPAGVMDEIAALTPIYRGISHSGLGQEGLQWPCPEPGHPGTPILHVGRAARGLARFTPVNHQLPAELPDAEYPLVLTTGRVLEHYHGGTMTRRVAGLHWLMPEGLVEVHPLDAQRFAVRDGERVRLRSRRGALAARARFTEGITPGTVFLPFHFAEAAANLLTHAALDPVAKIPEYKVCAVAVDPLPEESESAENEWKAPVITR